MSIARTPRAALILTLIAAVSAAVPAAAGPESTNRDDCGFNDDPAPDFSLVDDNPTSSTYGETITQSDLRGKVVFLMFIRSSCGHCQSLSTYLQVLWNEKQAEWGDDVAFVLVNMVGWEADMPAFCGLHDLMTLQDTSAEHAADDIGASLYWNYILDRDGKLVTLYYSLSLPADEARIIAEIEGALGSK